MVHELLTNIYMTYMWVITLVTSEEILLVNNERVLITRNFTDVV